LFVSKTLIIEKIRMSVRHYEDIVFDNDCQFIIMYS